MVLACNEVDFLPLACENGEVEVGGGGGEVNLSQESKTISNPSRLLSEGLILVIEL